MSLLTQIQVRRDTSANWTTVNPVLALGEIGLETDTGHLRIGDGSSSWTALTASYKRLNVRTSPQLAGTPTSADIALGAGALFVGADNIIRYINAAGTAYVAIDIVGMQASITTALNNAANALSTAGGAQTTANAAIPSTQKGAANGVATLGSDTKVPTAQMTGKLATTDLTDGASALAAKQNVPLNWNGTTPALVSSTNPIPSFGSNAFIYTGTGGATLDGNTFQTGDMALWNGTVFTKVILGGGYLGSFASTSALQTAYPAASNVDCDALVAGVLYKSDGSSWLKNITSAQVGAANGVASLDGSGYVPAAQSGALTGDVTRAAGTNTTVLTATAPALLQQPINFQTGTSYTLALSDAGNSVDMANAAANTLTIPPNSSVAFPLYTVISVSQGGAGTTTIAAGSGVTIVKPSARSLAISAQYETAFLQKVGTDTWRALVG